MDLYVEKEDFDVRKSLILAAAIILAASGGYLDMMLDKYMGDDVAFNIFFLIPVGIAAWFIGIRSGILVSAVSAVSCYMAHATFSKIEHENHIVPLWNSVEGFIFFLFMAFLLYALRRELMFHRQLASEDFLTKASNSRAFYNYANIELARISRYKKPLTLVYLDIDDFKQVNDTQGHNVGDELLVAFVNAIRKNIRATDAVSRLGGDEFALLLPEMGAASVEPFFSHLREVIDAEMNKKGWYIKYSAGVVTCTKPPESVPAMIKLADDAMFAVKKQGKNSVKYTVYG